MPAADEFAKQCAKEIEEQSRDPELQEITSNWLRRANQHKYSYHFEWLNRPIIQYPQDVLAMQEVIWSTNPDLVIETGVAHGGSLILSASMLALRDMADAVAAESPLDPTKTRRKVLGIDVEIRPHNRAAIEAHPMFNWIQLLEGSSTSREVIEQVTQEARSRKRVLVFLDSNHTHEHVLAELHAYAPLVSPGSYCVVFDTIIEDLPQEAFPDRPWGKGDNPKTAVRQFLGDHPEFEEDKELVNKLLITVAPGGFLKRVAM